MRRRNKVMQTRLRNGSSSSVANRISIRSTLTLRSHAEYVEGGSLEEMVTEDLVAERVAIESYREMIAYMETRDSTTRRMLEGILAKEEEHAEELASMREDIHHLLGKPDTRSNHAASKTRASA